MRPQQKTLARNDHTHFPLKQALPGTGLSFLVWFPTSFRLAFPLCCWSCICSMSISSGPQFLQYILCFVDRMNDTNGHSCEMKETDSCPSWSSKPQAVLRVCTHTARGSNKLRCPAGWTGQGTGQECTAAVLSFEKSWLIHLHPYTGRGTESPSSNYKPPGR